MATPSEILYIISARAGSGEQSAYRDGIVRLMAEHPVITMRFVVTEYAGHAADVARQFAERPRDAGKGPRIVYALGGDGTAHEVAGALAGSATTFGLVPTGTANDLAKFLYGRRFDALDILRGTAEPAIVPIDLYDVNGTPGINLASFGYDTVVLAEAYRILEKHPSWSKKAYALAVLRTAFQPKSTETPIRWEFETVDGEHITGEDYLALAVAANAAYYGDGYYPAPMASMRDGVLEILLIRRMGFLKFVSLIRRYRRGTHVDHPDVMHYRCTRAHFSAPDGHTILANSDGEIMEPQVLDIGIRPHALTLAVPKGYAPPP